MYVLTECDIRGLRTNSVAEKISGSFFSGWAKNRSLNTVLAASSDTLAQIYQITWYRMQENQAVPKI